MKINVNSTDNYHALRKSSTEEKLDVLLNGSSNKKFNMIFSNVDESTVASTNISLPGKRYLSNRIRNKRRVHFSNVEVREYPMILGDNPAVSSGPPITIDWEYSVRYQQDMDEHIKMTPLPRRSEKQMVMPSFYRKNLLREGGYSDNDIQWASMEADFVTSQRIATIKSLRLTAFQLVKNRIKKRMKKISINSKKVHSGMDDFVKEKDEQLSH